MNYTTNNIYCRIGIIKILIASGMVNNRKPYCSLINRCLFTTLTRKEERSEQDAIRKLERNRAKKKRNVWLFSKLSSLEH